MAHTDPENRRDKDRKPNRLIEQKSPYLLQHAYNPVDWYPWGEEAFAAARREDKPIFLSVGYSTCHWCHVMERESFEDPEVAKLLNELFINIKLDREERPDVDRVYMTYVQLTSGHGGWPMSVWLTPGLEPFFAGTYFPPDGLHGRPGFSSLIRTLGEAWRDDRDKIAAASSQAIEQLRRIAEQGGQPELLDAAPLFTGFKMLQRQFDAQNGGFGGAPKFPRPVSLSFLLRYFVRTGDDEAAEMVLLTLRKMADGGIHDQLGGGFHRYSVDARWHVPHFEKMLYDQAQLVHSYLDGYQLSGEPRLATVARSTCDYVLRQLVDEALGGLYSAEDADSLPAAGDDHKKEGAFYVWTHQQLARLLGDDAAPFSAYYGATEQGNADDPHGELTGTNVLDVSSTLEQVAQRYGQTSEQIERLLASGRERLLKVRSERPRPHLDDKIICSWNGLMIGALARAGAVLDEPSYLEAARRAAQFCSETLYDRDQRILYRRHRDGQRAVKGLAEDYAALVSGLLDLYEASLELRWLQVAEQLTERQIELFFDDEGGGFFADSGEDPSVLVRVKDDYDGAEPSANSLSACNLLRLAAILGREAWSRCADATLRCFSARLKQTPIIMPQMLVALDSQRNPPMQLIIAGERGDERTEQLLAVARQRLLPDAVVVLADDAFRAAYGERLPHVASMSPAGGRPTAYLCRDFRCDAPTSDPEKLAELLPERGVEAQAG